MCRLIAIFCLLFHAATLQAADWVPPGFEALAEPQITEVDVHYGGYYLTSALARFTIGDITFLDPETLVQQIPDLADPAATAALLSGPLPTNAAQLCHSEFQLECGSLATDSVAVIFDRSLLRAWVFIGSSQLVTRNPQDAKYLPDPQAGLSLYAQNAVYFSRASGDLSFNLYTNSQLAWGANNLVTKGSLTDDGLVLDTLAWERDYRGRQYQFGVFQGETSGYGFLTTRNFLGAGIKSSVLTRTDFNQSLGNAIELFIESRSRIEIFSEGRLLSTGFYDVGNQVLDTAGLPAGAYDIDIRITDAGGNVRTETRFFSKSSYLPPSDEGQYFLQAGVTGLYQSGNWHGDDATPLLRGGYSRRVGEATALSAGLSLTDRSVLAEAVMYRQGRNFDLRASLAGESTGSFAQDLSLRYNHPLFNVIASYRNASGKIENSQLEIARKITSLNLDIPFSKGRLTLFARLTAGNGDDRRSMTSHGVRWRFLNNSAAWEGIRAGFELSRNDGENLGLLYFSYRFGNSDAYYMASPQLSYGDNAEVLRGSLQAGWRREDAFSTRTYSVRAISDSRRSLEASLGYEGALMGSNLNVRLDESGVSAFGQLNNSLAWSSSGTSLGSRESSGSAFQVRVENAPADALFEVRVNGGLRKTIVGDSMVLIPVAPFQTYDIDVVPVGDSILNLDKGSMQRTVYPGNVIGLVWQAQQVVIAYGRLADAQGSPIVGAVLDGALSTAITDERGYFQAEIPVGTSGISFRKGQSMCEFSLPFSSADDLLLSTGTQTCAME